MKWVLAQIHHPIWDLLHTYLCNTNEAQTLYYV
jgi:hypothetical protein